MGDLEAWSSGLDLVSTLEEGLELGLCSRADGVGL